MSNLKSNIRDNHKHGNVGDFLKSKIEEGSSLSIVSAYFTIHAFQALKESLTEIKELRFLFGEPRFIKSLDPEKTDKKAYKIEGEDEGLKFEDRLRQNWVAKECAAWIREKVKIQSIRKSNLMHAKMYHIANNGAEDAIVFFQLSDFFNCKNAICTKRLLYKRQFSGSPRGFRFDITFVCLSEFITVSTDGKYGGTF